MTEGEMKTLIEQEVMKIYAVVDMLTLVDPGDTERNTIATLGAIIEEAAVKMVGYIGLEYPRVKGRRKRGLEGLKYNVPKLFRYLEERGLTVESVGVKEAQEYLTWLSQQKKKDGGAYKDRSIQSITNAAINFYAYLKRKGVVYANPFKEVERVRIEKRLPGRILKEKEMEKVLEEVERYEGEGEFRLKKRRYLMHVASELMYGTGMRISEVVGLRPEDIDYERGMVRIREGKGGRSRVGYMNEYAKEVVRMYVEEVRGVLFKESGKREERLFGVRSVDGLRNPLNEVLLEVTKKLGLPKMTSHGFRHAVGYHLLRAGCDIRYIQEILGHRRLKTTEVYTKVEKGDLKRVLDRYHPRRWRGGGRR